MPTTREQIVAKIGEATTLESVDALLAELLKTEPEALRDRITRMIRSNNQNAGHLQHISYEFTEENREDAERLFHLAQQMLIISRELAQFIHKLNS